LLLAVEPGAKGLTLHEGHHIKEEGIGFARVEQRQDVRVLQVGRQLDLSQEPLGADDGGQLRPEHFHGDPPSVSDVLSEVDRRHAAGAELPLELITAGKSSLELREKELGHGLVWFWGAGRWRELGGLASWVTSALCARQACSSFRRQFASRVIA